MGPNIFKYATSELSQDAMICWILEWINYDEKIMKQFSKDFIGKILDLNNINNSNELSINKVIIKKQYNNIDVLALVYFENFKIIPIIIEDKTFTTLHDEQLERYYKDIVIQSKNDENVIKTIGVYYKTGFIYDKEVNDVEQAGYKIFDRKMMINLMNKYKGETSNEIFHNYLKYLEEIQCMEDEINDFLIKDNMDKVDNVLRTFEGQWILMKSIFKDSNIKCIYNGSSFGRPWTQCSIIEQFSFKEFPDGIFYRLDYRNEGYYLSIRQYLNYADIEKCKRNLNETNQNIILEDKKKRLKKLKECFSNAINNLEKNNIDILQKGSVSNRGQKESEIAVFFINKQNTFNKISEFIAFLNDAFQNEIIKEFGLGT